MKKYLLVVSIFFLLAVCGCKKSEKVVCTKNITEENVGYIVESRVTGILKDNLVTKEDSKVIMTFDNHDNAVSSYEAMKKSTPEEVELNMKKNVITLTELQEFTESVSKDAFINAYMEDGYTCE